MVDGSKLFLNLELTVLGLTYLFLDSTSEMRALPGWVFDAISHLLEAMPSAEWVLSTVYQALSTTSAASFVLESSSY